MGTKSDVEEIQCLIKNIKNTLEIIDSVSAPLDREDCRKLLRWFKAGARTLSSCIEINFCDA